MHDLSQIARLNADAVRKDIPNQLAQGKHVVASYTGLHFVNSTAYDTPEQAEAAKKALDSGGSADQRHVILAPGDELPS